MIGRFRAASASRSGPGSNGEAGRVVTILLLVILVALGAASVAFIQKWKAASSRRDLMTGFMERDYVCCDLSVARREPRCETVLAGVLELSRGAAGPEFTTAAANALRNCPAASFVEFAGDPSALRLPVPFFAAKLRSGDSAIARRSVQLLFSDDTLAREVEMGVRNGRGPMCAQAAARSGAANAANRKCPGASLLVDGLAALLTDEKETPALREKAAAMLGELGDSASPAIPALVRSLESRHASVRGAASAALIAMGETAYDALPAVERRLYREPRPGLREKMLADLSSNPRIKCCYRLFEPPFSECGEALVGMAKWIRNSRFEAPVSPELECPTGFLLSVGGDGAIEQPFPTLAAALRAPVIAARQRAARIISLYAGTSHWRRSADSEIVPALQEALRSGIPPLVLDAAEALRQIDEPPPSEAPALDISPLLEALRQDSSDRRAAAAWALGAIGRKALPAVPALQKALDAEDESVGDASYDALNRIAGAAGLQRLGFKRDGKYEMRPEVLSALLDLSQRAVGAGLDPARDSSH